MEDRKKTNVLTCEIEPFLLGSNQSGLVKMGKLLFFQLSSSHSAVTDSLLMFG